MTTVLSIEVGPSSTCPFCGQGHVATAQIPHQITRADGKTVNGLRTIGLCPCCNKADDDAQGLLAFFAVHEKASADTAETFVSLVQDWALRVVAREHPSAAGEDTFEDVEEEYREWLDGHGGR